MECGQLILWTRINKWTVKTINKIWQRSQWESRRWDMAYSRCTISRVPKMDRWILTLLTRNHISPCSRDLQCIWCPMMEECPCRTKIQWLQWVIHSKCARNRLTLQKCKNNLQQRTIIPLDQKKVKRRRSSNRNRKRKVQRSRQPLSDPRKSSTVAYYLFNITLMELS